MDSATLRIIRVEWAEREGGRGRRALRALLGPGLAAASGALGAGAQWLDGTGLLLAFLAPVPLLSALRESRTRRGALLLGLIWGALFFGLGLAPVGGAVGWSYAVAAIAACALFGGGAAAIALRGAMRAARRVDARWRPIARAVAVAAVFTGFEWARAEFPFGLAFPWLLAGEPLVASDALLQTAELAGPFALTFVAVLGAAALARPSVAAVAFALAVLSVAVGYGEWRLLALGDELRDGPRVAVVSAIDWERLPAPATAGGRADGPTHFPKEARRLTLKAAAAGADLVVWPETAIAWSVDEAPGALPELGALARRAGVDLLLGAYSGEGGAIRNTAYHVGPDGAVRGAFDKVRLVPLAESLPDPARWPRLRATIERFVPEGFEPIAPGTRGEPSALADGTRVSALICYEGQHAACGREVARAGADLIATVANEERFTGTLAVRLAARHARLRAVETRRPLVRAVSGAPSLLIDPLGQVTPLADGVPQVARRLPGESASLYLAHGDAPAALAALIALAALVAGLRRPEDD